MHGLICNAVLKAEKHSAMTNMNNPYCRRAYLKGNKVKISCPHWIRSSEWQIGYQHIKLFLEMQEVKDNRKIELHWQATCNNIGEELFDVWDWAEALEDGPDGPRAFLLGELLKFPREGCLNSSYCDPPFSATVGTPILSANGWPNANQSFSTRA